MYFVNDKTPIDDEGSAPRLPSSEYETNFVAHETNPSFVMLIAGICLAKFGTLEIKNCWSKNN